MCPKPAFSQGDICVDCQPGGGGSQAYVSTHSNRLLFACSTSRRRRQQGAEGCQGPGGGAHPSAAHAACTGHRARPGGFVVTERRSERKCLQLQCWCGALVDIIDIIDIRCLFAARTRAMAMPRRFGGGVKSADAMLVLSTLHTSNLPRFLRFSRLYRSAGRCPRCPGGCFRRDTRWVCEKRGVCFVCAATAERPCATAVVPASCKLLAVERRRRGPVRCKPVPDARAGDGVAVRRCMPLDDSA
eukprot:357215-Chlamydomonas_euryale.AAC.6